MHRQALVLLVALSLFAGCATEPAAEPLTKPGAEPAPAADDDATVAAYVEALGGLDRIRAIESLRATGTYVYNGLEHPLTISSRRRSSRFW